MIIGIHGRYHSGKDEVARILVEHCGFERRAFADPLKREVADIIAGRVDIPDDVDIPGDVLEILLATTDESLVWAKPTIPEIRRVLQAWGTEVRRRQDQSYWLDRLEGGGIPELCVIPDVRFPNEGDWVNFMGGEVWHVIRPQRADYADPQIRFHESEHAMEGYQGYSVEIVNDASLAGLKRSVLRIMGQAVAA